MHDDQLRDGLDRAFAALDAAQQRSNTLLEETRARIDTTGRATGVDFGHQIHGQVLIQMRNELRTQLEPIHAVLRHLLERYPSP